MENYPKKRIGLIGSSAYGESLLTSLFGISKTHLVGLCELESNSTMQTIASQQNIPIFPDVTALLIDREIDWLINISDRTVAQYHLLQEMHPDLTIVDSHIAKLILETIKNFNNFYNNPQKKNNNRIEDFLWQIISNIVNNTQPIYRRLEHIAFHDPLTGLYNRNIFIELLEREISRSYRQLSSIALATADIDHFKNINDKFGHNEGDQVLKQLGEIFRDSCRKSDMAARYGGEEFVVVLPNTDLKSAATWCERIRRNTETLLKRSDGTPVTISLGVVCLHLPQFSKESSAQISPDLLLGHADKMLYAAKNAGRNQVASTTIKV
ncbi:MAG: GGDEF domain-containing protein [Candidatus Latescibacterota bacterium]|nr:GGDEF domain-containing protein [Candidatus Latescibacterota bacterium]